MKRPMCVIGLSLTVSTLAAFFFSMMQMLLLSLAAALTGVLILILQKQRGFPVWMRIVCVVCMTVSLGFAMQALHEQRDIAPFLALNGKTVQVEGYIDKLYLQNRGGNYTLTACFPDYPDLPATQVSVRAYGEIDFFVGDVVQCQVALTPQTVPDSGIRYANGSFLTGTLIGEMRLHPEGYELHRAVSALRTRLRNHVYAVLPAQSADVVTAMVLGILDNLDTDQYTALQKAGTVHLLSVSGLHLSVLTGTLLRALKAFRLPAQLQALLALMLSALFVVLVGLAASIIRAFVMTGIGLLAGMLGGRRKDSLSALGLAVTLICLIWPEWLLGKGFWLSAGSTLGILLFTNPISQYLARKLGHTKDRPRRLIVWIADSLSVSIAAYVVTIPLLIFFYGQISVFSPLTNLLIAPFIPLIICGGMLCALLGNISPILLLFGIIIHFCTAAVLEISTIMASIPYSTFSLDETWMLIWLGLVVVCLIYCARGRHRRKLISYSLLLLVLAYNAGSLSLAHAERRGVQLVTIEGCDAAMLIQYEEAVILGTPNHYEIGRLLRYLDFRGIKKIKAVIATDSGDQMTSGLLKLADRYPIDCLIGPNDGYILQQLADALPEVPVYSSGYATLQIWGGVHLSFPVPGEDLIVRIGHHRILKTTVALRASSVSPTYSIQIFSDQATAVQGGPSREPTPVGRLLYQEARYFLLF